MLPSDKRREEGQRFRAGRFDGAAGSTARRLRLSDHLGSQKTIQEASGHADVFTKNFLCCAGCVTASG
jgi:hypothetical protein